MSQKYQKISNYKTTIAKKLRIYKNLKEQYQKLKTNNSNIKTTTKKWQ